MHILQCEKKRFTLFNSPPVRVDRRHGDIYIQVPYSGELISKITVCAEDHVMYVAQRWSLLVTNQKNGKSALLCQKGSK